MAVLTGYAGLILIAIGGVTLAAQGEVASIHLFLFGTVLAVISVLPRGAVAAASRLDRDARGRVDCTPIIHWRQNDD